MTENKEQSAPLRWHPQEIKLVEADGVTLTSEGLAIYAAAHRDARKREAFTEQSVRQSIYPETHHA